MEIILLIAKNTFRESIRSKILYSVVFFAVVLVTASVFFGRVSIGDSGKIIKDFGLASISFFTVAFVVIAGALMLNKELAKKTIYNILAKPVSRTQFIAGKYLGMLQAATVLLVLLGFFLSGFMGIYERKFDLCLLQGYLFIFFELIILSALAIFFSAIVVTPLLSGLFAFSIFLVGRCSQYIISFAELVENKAAKLVYWVLPHFDSLYAGNEVIYGVLHSLENTLWSAVYSLGYAGVLIILACMAFQKRQFN